MKGDQLCFGMVLQPKAQKNFAQVEGRTASSKYKNSGSKYDPVSPKSEKRQAQRAGLQKKKIKHEQELLERPSPSHKLKMAENTDFRHTAYAK